MTKFEKFIDNMIAPIIRGMLIVIVILMLAFALWGIGGLLKDIILL